MSSDQDNNADASLTDIGREPMKCFLFQNSLFNNFDWMTAGAAEWGTWLRLVSVLTGQGVIEPVFNISSTRLLRSMTAAIGYDIREIKDPVLWDIEHGEEGEDGFVPFTVTVKNYPVDDVVKYRAKCERMRKMTEAREAKRAS